jgi:hypothetical protein
MSVPKQLSIEEIVELRGILTSDEPLGPSNAENLLNTPLAANLLFERQNAIYGELMGRAGILVGRRGSGKTAFLNQLQGARNCEFLVVINAPNAFPEIVRSVRGLFGERTPIIEVVEKLWDVLVWCCVFGQLLTKNSDARLQTIRNFANRLAFSSEDKPEVIILKVVQALQKRSAAEIIDSPLRLETALTFDTVSFGAAREAAHGLLKKRTRTSDHAPVLVLMDTLEDYRIETNDSAVAISGLLRYLGHQSSNRGRLDIRFCLPAELYAELQSISTNAMKDFSSQTLLHWHAGDLLSVATHRLSLYLRLHDPERFEQISERFDLSRRDGAAGYLRSILPERLINRNGVEELSVAYILRHTQLLPRHIIEVFNRMLSGIIDRQTRQFTTVPEASIIRAVQECEYSICNGVAQAYRNFYPYLQEICTAVLPELPRRFRDGDLLKAFNVHAKAVLKRLRDSGREHDLEYHRFKRMLIEVGAIGKQTTETDRYYEAEFEYTIPSHLVVASTDYLCIHPLFSGRYPHTQAAQTGAEKAIYPFGSDPHGLRNTLDGRDHQG